MCEISIIIVLIHRKLVWIGILPNFVTVIHGGGSYHIETSPLICSAC